MNTNRPYITNLTIELNDHRPVFPGEELTFMDSDGNLHEALVVCIRKDSVDVIMAGPLPPKQPDYARNAP